MPELKYRRILLKMSGEILARPQSESIDFSVLKKLAAEIAEAKGLGAEIGLVIGGGNMVRGAHITGAGMDRVNADYMGMLATVINALAMQGALENEGIEARVLTAIPMGPVAEPYIRRRALGHIAKERVVILAGGTGNPYFTTDTAAALRAIELKADAVIKGTKVDGVFDGDPVKNPNAHRFENLSYIDVLNKNLRVMDATAVSLCMENTLPIVVFNLTQENNLLKLLRGENVGTIVS